MSAWASKKDGTHWEPADVFPDLGPEKERVVERDAKAESQAILNKFLLMARRNKVH